MWNVGVWVQGPGQRRESGDTKARRGRERVSRISGVAWVRPGTPGLPRGEIEEGLSVLLERESFSLPSPPGNPLSPPVDGPNTSRVVSK